MPNLSLTKTWNYLATSTIERISPFISDVVTGRVFLLHVLDQSGMRQRVNGGTQESGAYEHPEVNFDKPAS